MAVTSHTVYLLQVYLIFSLFPVDPAFPFLFIEQTYTVHRTINEMRNKCTYWTPEPEKPE